ncbi:MAG: hypothetical protein EAZ42_03775 [Verrucomicrobia bacterium]|nr:MAG: hypothetical protein EAZ42_03775 [Verrucomicrobiota bacterium]
MVNFCLNLRFNKVVPHQHSQRFTSHGELAHDLFCILFAQRTFLRKFAKDHLTYLHLQSKFSLSQAFAPNRSF